MVASGSTFTPQPTPSAVPPSATPEEHSAAGCIADPTAVAEPWLIHRIIEKAGGPDGTRLGDFNGDGWDDLVVAFEGSGDIYLFLHPGTELVREPWPAVMVGNEPRGEDAFAMDVDGDGALDIISSHEGDTLAIYVHWGPQDPEGLLDPAQWETDLLPASLGVSWMFAVEMRVNNDEWPDIVAGGKSDYLRVTRGEVAWFEAPPENRRDLGAWQHHEIDYAGWVMSLIPFDVNGDGLDDLVVTDRDSDAEHQGPRWLENPGDSVEQLWPSTFFGDLAGTWPNFMDIGDLDNDGIEDFVIPLRNETTVLFVRRLNRGGVPEVETYPIHWEAPSGKAPKGVALMDVNCDGNLDIILSLEKAGGEVSGLGWLSQSGNPYAPLWTWHDISGPQGAKYDFPLLYDVDGDGDQDIIITEEVDGLGVVWYENPAIAALESGE
ncbi:MAG: VCBS repeat-containing protein [Anaerolineae bacterium]|nr:MAG: VCBS repeat-containing protein [Anaerolineae bacterium]